MEGLVGRGVAEEEWKRKWKRRAGLGFGKGRILLPGITDARPFLFGTAPFAAFENGAECQRERHNAHN